MSNSIIHRRMRFQRRRRDSGRPENHDDARCVRHDGHHGSDGPDTTGVRGILEVSPEFLAQQIDAVFEDIRPDAGQDRHGFLPGACENDSTEAAGVRGRQHCDGPGEVATSGSALAKDGAAAVMREELFPLSTVITPNIPEAGGHFRLSIRSREDMERAALRISETCGCAVLCKGGHSVEDASDVLCRNGTLTWFEGTRIDNPNTHGTGCTLSSAIASFLAKGRTPAGSDPPREGIPHRCACRHARPGAWLRPDEPHVRSA